MKIDDKDRCEMVISSEPINMTAVRVMFKGEEYKTTKQGGQAIHQNTCPRIRQFIKQKNNTTSIDFTGLKKGRLTVIGLFAGYGNPAQPYSRFWKSTICWVVRCSCGVYETRTAKSLRKIDNIDHSMCFACDDETYGVKKRDFFNKHGYYPNED